MRGRKMPGAAWVVSALVLAVGVARAQPPQVEVRGVRVVGEGYGGEMSLRPFNWTKGTTLSLLVIVPDGGLIGFDSDGSKLTALKDDKGTDLMKAPPAPKARGRFRAAARGGRLSPFAHLSKDGKACVVEVRTGQVPAKGATRLTAMGTLAFRRATGKKAFRQEKVALKPGTKIAAGAIPLTISKVGAPRWKRSGMVWEIALKADQDTTPIAAVRFFGGDGKEIESASAGGSRMTMMGRTEVTRNYQLARKVDAVTVEVEYWTGLKTISVPFDVTCSLGL